MEFAFLDLDQVTEEQLRGWEAVLSPEKRRRAERMPPRRRRQLIAGDALSRQMLAQQLNKAPEDIRFAYNENGKPLCDGAWFSLSHSGDIVVCAVSDQPIGLDVEQIRPVRPGPLKALPPEERTYAAAGEEPERFWRLWTAKEAWIKCRGGHLGQFRKPILTMEDDSLRYAEKGYIFRTPPCPAGYVAAICEREEIR